MLAKDMLFASLDSTIRKVKINDKYVLIIDTVGFIKSLPTMLIAAFKSTLDEIINSDIILHVRDISNQENSNQKLEVISQEDSALMYLAVDVKIVREVE